MNIASNLEEITYQDKSLHMKKPMLDLSTKQEEASTHYPSKIERKTSIAKNREMERTF
jgi:hypothetical protein